MQTFAEYNEFGYRVSVLDDDGDFVDEKAVECGNCSMESTAIVELDDPSCLPLLKIREFANMTLREVAEDCGLNLAQVPAAEYNREMSDPDDPATSGLWPWKLDTIVRYQGKDWMRLSKKDARLKYNEGVVVLICGVNLEPRHKSNNPFLIHPQPPLTFNHFVTEYVAAGNCQDKAGRYPAFYVEV